MAGSSMGTFLTVTTFGESHGGAVGVVMDGVTPGVPLVEGDIQTDLDRRRPGQSAATTPRAETDTVHLLSGIFEGYTTGTPIAMVIYNKDANPAAYNDIKDLFRPGHADYTYFKKYGLRDYRGSGRASGRETAARVAAGAVAKKLLARRQISVRAFTQRAAGIAGQRIDWDAIEQNIVRAADPKAAQEMIARVEQAREAGNSVGGVVECWATGLPAGVGEPVFDKLEADLAKAIMSIGATRGIEFGAGFAVADMTGRESNDEMNRDGFVSNNAGGTLGGIATGEPLIFRTAFKPTSSLSLPQHTLNTAGEEVICRTEGRHDPAIFPRAVPVVEAMTALVLEDHCKRQAALHA